jgi:hypothetical protein
MSDQKTDGIFKECLIESGWIETPRKGPLTIEEVDDFIEFLSQNGWHVEKKATPLVLSDEIRTRYPNLPDDYKLFLSRVSSLESPSRAAWFWCEDDFNREESRTLSGCQRVDYETKFLEWDDGDPGQLEYIKRFWDEHIPIAYYTAGDFAYLAISLIPEEYGMIVNDFSPSMDEDEPPTRVCGSFSELPAMLRWAIERGLEQDGPAELYVFVE